MADNESHRGEGHEDGSAGEMPEKPRVGAGRSRRLGAAATAFLSASSAIVIGISGNSPTATGTLQIAVADVPAGARADVVVEGPGGFRHDIERTTSLDVGPGRYVVAAAPLHQATAVDFGFPSRAVAIVAAGHTSTVAIDYDTVVPDTTRVLDASQLRATTGVAITPSTVSGPVAILGSERTGDVIAAGIGLLTPDGLLRRVKSVDRSGEMEVLTTTAANLEDAIPSGEFDESFSLTATGAATALTPQSDVVRAEHAQPAGFSGALSVDWHGAQCGGQVGLVPDFSLSIMPTVTFAAKWGLLRAKELKFEASVSEEATLKWATEAAAFCSLEGDTPALRFGSFTFFVGPVPVVVVPTLTGHGSLDGSFPLPGPAGFTQAASGQLGVEWKNGRVSTPNPSLAVTITPVQGGSYSEELSASLGPRITFAVYDLAGPYVGISLGAQYRPDDGSVHAFVRASAGISFKFLGFSTSADVPFKPFADRILWPLPAH